MTERPPGLDKLLDYVAEQLEEPTHCGKCKTAFDPNDTRFIGSRARYHLTPWCRECVSRCHDTEIADHRCVICQ